MSKVMLNQGTTEADYADSQATDDEKVIDILVAEWRFFRPDEPLVREILRLREKLGDNYLDKEYESHSATESGDDAEAVSSLSKDLENKSAVQLMFTRLADILGLNQGKDSQPSDSEEESIAQYRSFISERIYNHLAMLGRSSRTLRGEAFSISRELTEGIAEKIGLGLYLSSEIDDNLRQDTEKVLLRLAGDYQKWFLDKARYGAFETTWGNIYSADQKLSDEERADYPLILKADIKEAAILRAPVEEAAACAK